MVDGRAVQIDRIRTIFKFVNLLNALTTWSPTEIQHHVKDKNGKSFPKNFIYDAISALGIQKSKKVGKEQFYKYSLIENNYQFNWLLDTVLQINRERKERLTKKTRFGRQDLLRSTANRRTWYAPRMSKEQEKEWDALNQKRIAEYDVVREAGIKAFDKTCNEIDDKYAPSFRKILKGKV